LGSIDLPYTNAITNRHGKTYWFYRRAGRRVALPGEPGGAEWMRVYWAERASDEGREKVTPSSGRSVKRLVIEYFASPLYHDLSPSTRKGYRSSLKELVERVGEYEVSDFKFRHINKIIGDMANRPGAANNLLKRMRVLFKLAIRLEWIDRDPSDGVPRYRAGEIHTWTDEEIEQFEDYWPAGSEQRLAFTLQLCTGQRNSDVVAMQWPRDGLIQVTQEKTGAKLWVPVMSALKTELALHPREHLVILTTAYGKPRSVAGYGNWMRDAFREAGMALRCSPHGLRKAAAAHLADAGCTTHEIMSITGHKTLKEVERYTRAAQQKTLAKSATMKRNKNERMTTLSPQSDNPSKSSA
jgi:integrase